LFPAPGIWEIEPTGARLTIRDPASLEPPLIELPRDSGPLPFGCDKAAVAQLLVDFAQIFNSGRAEDLWRVLASSVNVSFAGGGLPGFLARELKDVGPYVQERHRVGERIYPYRATVACCSGTADGADLAVYFIREAPEFGSQGGDQRRNAFAGGLMRCADRVLLRFNAAITTGG
jgi:hypothetical protein